MNNKQKALDLHNEYKRIDLLNKKAVSAITRKVKRVASKTSPNDHAAVLFLDILATRLNIYSLDLADQ